MSKPLWMWAVFLGVIAVLLIMDLGLFNKKDHEIGVRESLWLSAFYISIALLFSLWIWYQLGSQSWAEYLTGFLIEKSLSVDNIFVISLIFSSLAIPLKYQHRVLFWGIIGVVVLRAIMIALGAQLISEFSWVLYIFAAFMIVVGIKMCFPSKKTLDIKENKLLKFMNKHLPVVHEMHGNKFLVKLLDPKKQVFRYFLTPLMIALILVELTDLVFAVDSVPAIFTITNDPYIVYTSNIFAILGLRSLYFALGSILDRFYYLKYALALVLIFIGSKVFIADMLGIAKIPAPLSLGVTFGLLLAGCIYSIYKRRSSKVIT